MISVTIGDQLPWAFDDAGHCFACGKPRHRRGHYPVCVIADIVDSLGRLSNGERIETSDDLNDRREAWVDALSSVPA